jgi:hypothetical protein
MSGQPTTPQEATTDESPALKNYFAKIPIAGFVTIAVEVDEKLDEDEVKQAAFAQYQDLSINMSINGPAVEDWQLDAYESIIDGNVCNVDVSEIEIEEP